MSGEESSDARLAFIDISVFADGSIRGGVLVTDIVTRPYEFRVTTPVKPTAMQRVLYGNTLADYVYGELIGVPLIKAIKEKLSLVVCRNEKLLIMRPNLDIPVVVITKTAQDIRSEKPEEVFSTLSFKAHSSYSGEEEWARALLTKLIEKQDAFEPFDRLRTAMDEVHKQKVGSQ
jgi:hypothetical protein